jgi:hypothetical protein
MLGAALIHPDKREVMPLMPEPIIKQDGTEKNDCERNAAKRFITKLRQDHPHLKVIVTKDGLSSNAPHIQLLHDPPPDGSLGPDVYGHVGLLCCPARGLLMASLTLPLSQRRGNKTASSRLRHGLLFCDVSRLFFSKRSPPQAAGLLGTKTYSNRDN